MSSLSPHEELKSEGDFLLQNLRGRPLDVNIGGRVSVTEYGTAPSPYIDIIIEAIYFVISFQIMMCSVFMIEQWTVESVLIGIILFMLSIGSMALEFYQPLELLRWMPFWRTFTGKNMVLLFLGVVSLHGFFLGGLVALTLTAVLTFIEVSMDLKMPTPYFNIPSEQSGGHSYIVVP